MPTRQPNQSNAIERLRELGEIRQVIDLELRPGLIIVGTVSHLGEAFLETPWKIIGRSSSGLCLQKVEDENEYAGETMWWDPSPTTVYLAAAKHGWPMQNETEILNWSTQGPSN